MTWKFKFDFIKQLNLLKKTKLYLKSFNKKLKLKQIITKKKTVLSIFYKTKMKALFLFFWFNKYLNEKQ